MSVINSQHRYELSGMTRKSPAWEYATETGDQGPQINVVHHISVSEFSWAERNAKTLLDLIIVNRLFVGSWMNPLTE